MVDKDMTVILVEVKKVRSSVNNDPCIRFRRY